MVFLSLFQILFQNIGYPWSCEWVSAIVIKQRIVSMISIIDGTVFTIFDRNDIFDNSIGESATSEEKGILVQKE
jgi:hypothetical protein